MARHDGTAASRMSMSLQGIGDVSKFVSPSCSSSLFYTLLLPNRMCFFYVFIFSVCWASMVISITSYLFWLWTVRLFQIFEHRFAAQKHSHTKYFHWKSFYSFTKSTSLHFELRIGFEWLLPYIITTRNSTTQKEKWCAVFVYLAFKSLITRDCSHAGYRCSSLATKMNTFCNRNTHDVNDILRVSTLIF